METNNLTKAEEYYKLVGEKKSNEIGKYLHPDVEFYGPMAILKGKDSVIRATQNFMNGRI